MTPEEAFGRLRVTLPDVVDGVIRDGIGQPETGLQAHALADQLRAAKTLDEAVALDEQLDKLAATDPPFRDALLARTQGLRDKSEAESPLGQVRQAAADVQDAAKTGATVLKDVGFLLLLGVGVLALAEARNVGRTVKGALA